MARDFTTQVLLISGMLLRQPCLPQVQRNFVIGLCLDNFAVRLANLTCVSGSGRGRQASSISSHTAPHGLEGLPKPLERRRLKHKVRVEDCVARSASKCAADCGVLVSH